MLQYTMQLAHEEYGHWQIILMAIASNNQIKGNIWRKYGLSSNNILNKVYDTYYVYMYIFHATIPLIPRLFQELNSTRNWSTTYNQWINLLSSIMERSFSTIIFFYRLLLCVLIVYVHTLVRVSDINLYAGVYRLL